MKIHFSLVVKGEESFGQKFEKTLQENPHVHMDLIRAIGQTVMLAFRLNDDDKIIIDSFRAGKIPEKESQAIPQPEKNESVEVVQQSI